MQAYEPGHEDALFSGFGRVLLQDSSVLPLPAFMARYYKGSRNGYDTASSQAKVQAIPDIKNRSYVKFDISSSSNEVCQAYNSVC